MSISIIAAMDKHRVIGTENRLPWRLPADMQWFRRHTLGKPVVMGRKTFASLGRPLAGRTNIVITRDPGFRVDGVVVVHNIDDAIEAARKVGQEVMIIGGASFYEQMLPRADKLYLTLVDGEFDGDAWFPEFDMAEWRELESNRYDADEKNPHDYRFVILERRE
ncbi:MAG: type 3 dihydrofolate reductase [Gammaproteobacteria bacterium]|nr:MAG: type 3 dihydrofolate reductase [Gammaproteobacteria bacterium]